MSSKKGSFVFVASAPGKVILSGEHAVVHGSRALATAIDKRTFVEVSPIDSDQIVLNLKLDEDPHEVQWNITDFLPLVELYTGAHPSKVEQECPALFTALNNFPHCSEIPARVFVLLYVCMVGKDAPSRGLRFRVRSALPMGAGLGSSASFCVSLAAACMHLRKVSTQGSGELTNDLDKTHLNDWAFEAEKIIHGNPSGVDNAVSCFGHAVLYRRGEPLHTIDNMPTLSVLITNTRVPRNTKQLVAGVGVLLAAHPATVKPLITSIDSLTGELVDLLAQRYKSEISYSEFDGSFRQLIRLNQHLLNALGVGHPSIDHVMQASAQHDFPAKLTGAGGGGCTITVVPEGVSGSTVDKFKSSVEELGYECFSALLGGDGVQLHLNVGLGDVLAV